MEALHFAYDIGLHSLELAIENKELLCLLQSVGPCLASVGNLVDEICYFKRFFVFLQFSYVKNCVTGLFMSWQQKVLSPYAQV